MLKINDTLLDIIAKAGLPQETALHVCFAIFSRGEDGLDWCHEHGFINQSNEHKYRIALTKINPETKIIELRYPLVIFEQKIDFIDFYIQVGAALPNTKGKLDNTQATKFAYEALVRQIEDFSQQKLIDCTVEYYKREEYSKKLSNYLQENALLEYKTYKPKQLNII